MVGSYSAHQEPGMFDSQPVREVKHDIFSNYFNYVSASEPPIVYHRWCYLSCLAATLGRNAYFTHGHFRVFPNLYVMLLGEPAARKSTSIKLAKKLLSASGYSKFSADKTSKEKFLLDLEGLELDETDSNSVKQAKLEQVTNQSLWGEDALSEPREVFIVADEFNEFSGVGNLDFFTTLGNLWDWDDTAKPFSQRLKSSRSVSIYQPTISILAGNTPELFARAFPPETIGTGFLSRIILVHGERSGRRVTFPPAPDEALAASLHEYLAALRSEIFSGVECSSEAMAVLHEIYQGATEIADTRFKGYSNRRFTQLLKLCLILTCAQFKRQVDADEVIFANTILSHAEALMPKAMGQFGKGKNSDVANKIMQVLESAVKPMSINELWSYVHKDLGNNKDLVELMSGLTQAGKVQMVSTRHGGFLPRKEVRVDPKFVDWSLLSQEERDML